MIDIDGEPWFVAADVCETLGLKPAPSNGSYQNHYRRFASDELGLQVVASPNGKSIRMKLVSESGFYKLVLRSTKPEATDFQDWVTRVVLPAIRKDGGYVMGEEKVAAGEMSEDELVATSAAWGLGSTIKLGSTIEDNQQVFGVTAPV